MFSLFDNDVELPEDFFESETSYFPSTYQSTSHSGVPRPFGERSENHNLVGLQNQGTTCYLNSLLQLLYMTVEFRARLFELDEEELGHSEFQKAQFVENVECTSNITPKNEENDDIDSIIGQFLESEPSQKSNKIKYRRIPLRLRELFASLQMINQNAVSTQALTTSFGWKNNDIGIQHDITELNRVFFDALHRSLKGITNGENLIPSLYGGILVNQLVCLGCGNVRDREEEFQDIMLQVKDFRNISESLKNYVQTTKLRKENRYECDHCTLSEGKGKQDANMAVSFRHLPKILVFSLCRFGFDWNTQQRFKINSAFEFPLVLDMEPFSEQQIRSKLTGVDSSSENDAKENLNDDNGDGSTVVNDSEENEEVKKVRLSKKERKLEVENRLLMESSFNEDSEHLYDLLGVVVHTGGAHGGHYYAYIKDRLHQKEGTENEDNTIENDNCNWFEFNDSTVRPINVSQLAQEYGGSSHCAYMLAYVKRDRPQVKLPTPIVPASECQKIAQLNMQLEAERAAWKEQMDKITVSVSTVNQFDTRNQTLYFKQDSQTYTSSHSSNDNNFKNSSSQLDDGDSDMIADLFNTQNATPTPSLYLPKLEPILEVTISKHLSLSELLFTIIEQLENNQIASANEQLRLDVLELKYQKRINVAPMVHVHPKQVELSSALKQISTEEQWMSETPIHELGFGGGENILIWCHEPKHCDELPPKIPVRIYNFAKDESKGNQRIADAEIMEFEVTPEFTIARLKGLLHPIVLVPIEQQLLCLRREMSLGILEDVALKDSVWEVMIDNDNLLLSDLCDTSCTNHDMPSWGVTFSVEKMNTTGNQFIHPKVIRHNEQQAYDDLFDYDEDANIVITVLWQDPDQSTLSTCTCFQVECQITQTVEEFKAILLTIVDSSTENEGRYSEHTDIQLQHPSGRALSDPSRSLLSYDIMKSTELIAIVDQREETLTSTPLIDLTQDAKIYDIEFRVFLDNNEQGINNTLLTLSGISPSTTLKELKSQMVQHASKHFGCNLTAKTFRVRRMNFMQELSYTYANEDQTLVKLSFPSVSLLGLEEGRMPLPEEVQFYVNLYVDNSCAREDDQHSLIHSPTFFQTNRSLSFEEEVHWNMHTKNLCHIPFSRLDSLLQLKSLILTTISTTPSCYCELLQLNIEPTRPQQIRVWNGNRLMCKDSSSLKKNGIPASTTANIIIQVLPEPEVITASQTILFLYSWQSIESDSRGEFSFVREFTFESKQATQAQLLDSLSVVFNAPKETLSVCKYSYHQRKWIDIVSAKTRQSSEQKHQSVNNLRKPPTLLSHGDVIVVNIGSDHEFSWNSLFELFRTDPRIPQKSEKHSFVSTDRGDFSFVGHVTPTRNRVAERGITIDIGEVDGLDYF